MWKIIYHPFVGDRDFKKISKNDQNRIISTIEKKLMIDPVSFGKPLLRKLKGYFRLRLDPYRVIYRIERDIITVFIIHVGLRKDSIAYTEAVKRLNLF